MKQRIRLILVAIAALLFALLLMLFRWWEHSQVYHPSRTLIASGRELQRPMEDVTLKTSDGIQLHGWFFPSSPTEARSGRAVLFCHGNGGNISHRLDVYSALLGTGVSVLTFDYRGYGRSEGRPGEAGTYRDAEAAYLWLQSRGFAAKNIIIYGESLGGGVASELCVRLPSAGLVLQSTFTSIPDIGAELFPWMPVKLLSSIRYDTRERLPRLRLPVLVMHSREDGLVPFKHAEQNFAAANEPKFLCELEGGHNEPLSDRTAYVTGFERFLKHVEQGAASTPTQEP